MKKRFLTVSAIYWFIGIIVIAFYAMSCGFSAGHDEESAALITECIYEVRSRMPLVVAGIVALYVLVIYVMIGRWEKSGTKTRKKRR